jgi:hypothetical protein
MYDVDTGQKHFIPVDYATAEAAGEANPLRTLPIGVEFRAWGAGGGRYVRYDHLGRACNPEAASGNSACLRKSTIASPEPPGDGDYFAENGDARALTLVDLRNSLRIDLNISSGGRVEIVEGLQ